MSDLFKNRIILLLLSLLLLIIFLFVFNRLKDKNRPETVDPMTSATVYPSGYTARLFCTNGCKGHGQCGELANKEVLILTNQLAPATQNHTLAIPNGNSVTIKGSREEQTVGVFDIQLRETTLFYQVDWGGVSTWVAGWCVVNPS